MPWGARLIGQKAEAGQVSSIVKYDTSEAPLTNLKKKETNWVFLSRFESVEGISLMVATANVRSDQAEVGKRVVFLEPAEWAIVGKKIPSKGDKVKVIHIRARSFGDSAFVAKLPTQLMYFVVR